MIPASSYPSGIDEPPLSDETIAASRVTADPAYRTEDLLGGPG